MKKNGFKLLFLLLAVIPINSYAQNEVVSVDRYDRRGGISRQRRAFEDQAYYIKNARQKSDGTLEVRGGQTTYAEVGNASVGSLEALYGYYNLTTGPLVYSVKREDGVNDKVYRNTAEVTGDSFGAGGHNSIGYYKNKIFFSNGETPIFYTDPTSTTRTAVTGDPEPPKGKIMVFYRDRCYVAGADRALRWSNALMYTTLPECDFPVLNLYNVADEGGVITAVVAGSASLFAFTDNSYSIMTGVPDNDGLPGDMNWQKYSSGKGVLYPKMVTVTEKSVVFFASNRRVYSLTGYQIEDLDPNNYIQEFLTGVADSALDAVSIRHSGDEIWLYLPKSTSKTDGRMLVYSTALQSWTAFENINGHAFGEIRALDRFFVGSASGGYVREQNSGDTDYGTKIAFELVTRKETLGLLRRKKAWRRVAVQADIFPGDTLSFKYAGDANTNYTAFTVLPTMTGTGNLWGAELWGASAWGGKTATVTYAEGVDSDYRELQLQISGNVTAGTRFIGYRIEGDEIVQNN